MELLNTFDPETTKKTLERIDKLTAETQPKWGKMNVAEMLAHVNVAYELAYGEKQNKKGGFAKFMLKLLVKGIVVGDKPYKRNSRTAPEFMITDSREFEKEKARLVDYINKTDAHGASYFEGKESVSFGSLTAREWSNMFYKHLDHHLKQFGV